MYLATHTHSHMYTHTAVTCDLLEAPENGQISKSGTVRGSTTTYSCFPGFQLIGVAVRTCLENGQWSDSAPFCRRKYSSANEMILLHFLSVGVANWSCDPKWVWLVGHVISKWVWLVSN